MAGVLGFQVSPLHIFQRKFSSADLETALLFSHIYVISRRPPVRIDYSFAGRGYVFFSFSISTGESEVRLNSEIRLRGSERLLSRVYEDGEYFSIHVDDEVLHGDSWSLASFLTDARTDIARHEVLYVGMAYGRDGERNVVHRLRSHSTLQRIYEEHAGANWDIFVTPVEINGNTCSSIDHINDAEDGIDVRSYLKHFAQPSKIVKGRSKLSRESVELVEHILVSTFKPPYNEKLLTWDVSRPTRAMRIARRVGFRMLTLQFNGWNGLSRFVSEVETRAQRAHFLRVPLTGHPLSGPMTYDKSDPFGLIVRFNEHMADLIQSFDGMPSALSIFGTDAPEIRRPPQVNI